MWKNWLVVSVASAALLGACSEPQTSGPTTEEPAAPVAADTENNPLLADWNTPFEIPPFSEFTAEDYTPALEVGISELRADIEAITSNEEAPGFDNTIVALDLSGKTLTRVARVFGNITNTDTTDELRAMESEVNRRLTAESNAVYLNEALFEGVQTVYENLPTLGLDREQERLVELTYRDFTRKSH